MTSIEQQQSCCLCSVRLFWLLYMHCDSSVFSIFECMYVCFQTFQPMLRWSRLSRWLPLCCPKQLLILNHFKEKRGNLLVWLFPSKSVNYFVFKWIYNNNNYYYYYSDHQLYTQFEKKAFYAKLKKWNKRERERERKRDVKITASIDFRFCMSYFKAAAQSKVDRNRKTTIWH